MATITSTTSGDWTAGATWVGGSAPADGDEVVIASGHVVTFDDDHSAWVTGIDGLTITGTLNFETAAGTYYLMMKAATTISGAGTMNVGTEATPIPFAAKHTITGGAGWYIQGSGGLTMTVYAAEPTETYIRLSAAEAAGQTVLSVDTDVTGDIWAAGDTIRIDDINKGDESEERVIDAGGIAAGEITITVGLTDAKLEGAIVSLITRNVKFTGVGNFGLVQNFSSGNLTISGGQWKGYFAIKSCTDATILGGSFAGNSYALHYSDGATISDGVFSGNNNAFYFSDGIEVSGGIFSGNDNLFRTCNGVRVSGGIFSGTGNALNACAGSIISGGTFNGSENIINDSVGISVFGGEFSNSKYAVLDSSIEIKNATFTSNTYDIRTSIFTGYNTELTSGNPNYLYTSFAKEIYSYITDYAVAGGYKSWTKGGVTTLQSVVYPTGFEESYNLVLEDADNEGYFQRELSVGAGQSVNFDLNLRKDGVMTYLPRFQIFLKRSTDPFAGGTPEHEFIMTDSVDTWESETYTYSNDGTEDETLVIRCLGKAASGNVYGMYEAEILNVDLTSVLANLAIVDGIVDDILVDTGTTLPATLTTIDSNVDAILLDTGTDGVELTANAVDAILDEVVVDTYTMRDLLKTIGAKMHGIATGGGTTEIKYTGLDGTADVIVETVDSDGNRSNVTLTV